MPPKGRQQIVISCRSIDICLGSCWFTMYRVTRSLYYVICVVHVYIYLFGTNQPFTTHVACKPLQSTQWQHSTSLRTFRWTPELASSSPNAAKYTARVAPLPQSVSMTRRSQPSLHTTLIIQNIFCTEKIACASFYICTNSSRSLASCIGIY